jgi:hypothetical protein
MATKGEGESDPLVSDSDSIVDSIMGRVDIGEPKRKGPQTKTSRMPQLPSEMALRLAASKLHVTTLSARRNRGRIT